MSYVLHLGDCLDQATGLASLADKSVDHVITDPPYEAEAHTQQRRCRDVMEGRATSAALDFDPITDTVRDAIGAESGRLVRRWAIAFCQAEAVGTWRTVFVSGGLTWKRSCVWVKPDPTPQFTGDRPGTGYESIACAHSSLPGKSRWNGGGRPGVYTFLKGKDHVHPTEKPILLMEKLIRDFTDPGETILDPFAGSGTTGVAAIRLGRNFVGWEKDPRYHAIAIKRLAAAREQMELCA